MASSALVRKLPRILRYALPQWPSLVGILVLSLMAAAVAALQPWPLKILVDYALGGAALPPLMAEWFESDGPPGAATLIGFAALASITFFVLAASIDAALTLAWTVAGQRMVYSLATDVFLKLQRLSLLFHARRSVGDSLSRITGDTWTVYSLTDAVAIAPAKHVTTIATVGLIAWQLDPGLTLLMAMTVPVLVLSARYCGGLLKGASVRNRRAMAEVTAFVHQVLGAMPVVQVFSAQNRNALYFDRLASVAVRAIRGSAAINSTYAIINGAATTIGIALIVYAGTERVLTHQMSLGSLLVLIAYMRTLETAARGLLGTYGSVRTAEAGVDRVLEVLDSADAVHEPAGSPLLPPRAREGSGRIVFENVTFGYEPGRVVLSGINLEIRAGETLALVGSTGAGKSTLASLVPRFFDPWEGRVLVDGVDIRHVQLASLREEVALVLQESFILPLSVADNIAYGKPHASRDDIVAAAVAANAHEFICRLPHGYDSVLGEHGATLSGGQQQRISIARALLKDARILILDEPTAALDAASEQAVVDALERLMADRTTLIIAHRLTTVRRAHRIAVIESGSIQEIGAHAELLRAGGRYARLHALHAVTPSEALQ